MTSVKPKAISVREAATMLGISRAYAYRGVDEGWLPGIRLGRRIVIPLAAVERLLENAGAGSATNG